MEIWRDIPGYERLYQVSNLGRVRSRYAKNGRLSNEFRILSLGLDQDGYFKLTLCKDKKYKYTKVHRVVAETFISNEYNYEVINHIDGNKLNNRIENLEWCNVKHNVIHAHSTGLHKGCRTKVKLVNDNEILNFDSITEASEYLNVDRHILNKHRKIHGNKFKYKDYSVTLIGGKQGGYKK